MTDISDLIERAKAALEGVTEGPWDVVSGANGNVWHFPDFGKPTLVVTMGRMTEANAEFIAAARTLVPELVAALKAAQAENERLRALLPGPIKPTVGAMTTLREQPWQCTCSGQGGEVYSSGCPIHDSTVDKSDKHWRKMYDDHRAAQLRVMERLGWK